MCFQCITVIGQTRLFVQLWSPHVLFVAILDQAMLSIRDRLNKIESDIDGGLRRKVRKLNAHFSDLPDILVVSTAGKIQRAPKCQEHIKEEVAECQGQTSRRM
jgi:hypothetical protein